MIVRDVKVSGVLEKPCLPSRSFLSFTMWLSLSQLDSRPHSQVISTAEFGLGVIVCRAASVASVAGKHAYAAASSPNLDEMKPLKCSLMSISLPWEYIAYDLLFKGAPPVNMGSFLGAKKIELEICRL